MPVVACVRRLAVLGVLAATAACAATGAVPQPFPRPGDEASRLPPEAPLPPGERSALVGTALSLRGAPYRDGGSDPSGFDCSGFVAYVYAQRGVYLPRTVSELYRQGDPVDRGAIEQGDLVFFSTIAPGASHVGIAISGGEFVHAPSSSGVVRVEPMAASYWAARYVGARRLR